MVHHFQCEKPELTLQVDSKEGERDGKKIFRPVCVEFLDFDFITDNDDTAKKIKETDMFKAGQIFLATDSSIADANRRRGRKPKIVTGSRGTLDETKDLRSQLDKAQAEIAELKKSKVKEPKAA